MVYYGQQNKEMSRILRVITEGTCEKGWNKFFTNELHRSKSSDSERVYRNSYCSNTELNGGETFRRGRILRVNDTDKEIMEKFIQLTQKDKQIILSYALDLLAEQESSTCGSPTVSTVSE